MTTRRRDVLAIVGIIALVYGPRTLLWGRLTGNSLVYVDIPDLPPFRRLASQGQTSGAGPALDGIDPPPNDARRARADAVRAYLCLALFGNEEDAGVVPIAYFSEFRCPYCRALEQELDRLLVDSPGSFRIVQHAVPIFGPASDLAALASAAAARQGMQQGLRQRFMRTLPISEEASVLRVAADIGLDTERLARDMASREVQAELYTTPAIADVFGFIGTPGLVIGHTVLNGSIPYAVLRQIAEDEKSAPEPVC